MNIRFNEKKKMIKLGIFFIFIQLCFFLNAVKGGICAGNIVNASAAEITSAPRSINSRQFIMYIPSGVDMSEKYPLVMAFSPSADAESMINTWKGVAEKYKWIILASKESRNGLDMKQTIDSHLAIIRFVSVNYPIDLSKIIAAGFSGGGMVSHAFAMFYPRKIYAVVANTAMIHEIFEEGNSYTYPRGKVAVFLASPEDFRYSQMKKNRGFLEKLGWQTKWIEFQGGHTIAPEATYLEAAEWLSRKIKEAGE